MRLLESITQALNTNSLSYAVFGGTAIKAYNPQRVTNDIDVITLPAGLPHLAAVFGSTVMKDELGQEKIIGPGFEIFGDLLIHASAGTFRFSLDTLMVSRLERACLDGVYFWVLSREDHIVLKALLQRNPRLGKQDIQDIRVLAGASPLDVAYINQRIDLTASRGWADELLVSLQIL